MYYTCLQMRNEAQRSEQPQGHLPAGDRGDVGTQLNTTPCQQGSWSLGREQHVRLSSPTTLPSRDPARTSQLAAGRRGEGRRRGGGGQVEVSASVYVRGRGLTGMWPCHLLKCGKISHSIAAETSFSFHSDPHSLSITLPRLFSGAGVATGIVGGVLWGDWAGDPCRLGLGENVCGWQSPPGHLLLPCPPRADRGVRLEGHPAGHSPWVLTVRKIWFLWVIVWLSQLAHKWRLLEMFRNLDPSVILEIILRCWNFICDSM